jgi:hypothetical protein
MPLVLIAVVVAAAAVVLSLAPRSGPDSRTLRVASVLLAGCPDRPDGDVSGLGAGPLSD